MDMDKNVRPYLSEMIGTFALVFLSAGTVCTSQMTTGAGQPQPYLIGIALAEGFILTVALLATLHVSGGYLNPAITLMLWVFKRIDTPKACGLIGAQFLGSVLAGLLLRILFAQDVLMSARLGTPHLNLRAFGATDSFTWMLWTTGGGIELTLTFILTFAIFGTILDPRAPRLGTLGPGLAMTAIVLMGYPLTGAAANPARWLGPAIWEATLLGSSAFQDHVIYWFGPICGALLAGAVYQYLILPQERAAEPAPAAPPLGAAASLAKAKK